MRIMHPVKGAKVDPRLLVIVAAFAAFVSLSGQGGPPGGTTGTTGLTTGSTGITEPPPPGDYYAVSYEGGQRVEVGPMGTQTQPYTLGTSGTWEGWWGSHAPSTSPLSHTCSGSIKVKFQWMGHPDNTPKSVIIDEKCVTTWQTPANGNGSCNNLFGDSPNNLPPSGQTRGADVAGSPIKHPLVKDDPGVYFEFNVEPTAQASNSVADPQVVASVKYKAFATPVIVDLQGAYRSETAPGIDHDRYHVLMGQRVRAGVSAMGYMLEDYSWSVPLDVYHHFNRNPWGNQTGEVVPVDPAIWFTEDPSWRWKGQELGPGWISVQVTAKAYFGGQYVGLVTGRTKVQLYTPVVSYAIDTSGVDQYDAIGAAEAVRAWNDPLQGMKFTGGVATPEFLTTEQGYSQWLICQLAWPSRIIDGVRRNPASDYYELDYGWPYPYGSDEWPINENNAVPAQWPAAYAHDFSGTPYVSTHYAADSPAHPLDGVNSFNIHDAFRVFQMYMPPDGGLGSDWCPLTRLDWHWASSDSRSSWAYPFPTTHPGTVQDDSITTFPDFPNWSRIL